MLAYKKKRQQIRQEVQPSPLVDHSGLQILSRRRSAESQRRLLTARRQPSAASSRLAAACYGIVVSLEPPVLSAESWGPCHRGSSRPTRPRPSEVAIAAHLKGVRGAEPSLERVFWVGCLILKSMLFALPARRHPDFTDLYSKHAERRCQRTT